jgi:hypothetical protein
LLLRFLRSARSSWQLQHDGVLTFAQPGHEHDLPVKELKRIVMHVGLVFVDLLEAVQRAHAAFPDYHEELEEMVAEGDKVVVRLTITGT